MISIERAYELRSIIEKASQSLDDNTALTSVELFAKWRDLVDHSVEVDKGYKFRYGKDLYRTEQPKYTFTESHVPGAPGLESIFSKVDKSHAGTLEDPIPYDGNMEVYEGFYYSQDNFVHLCNRSSGQPLYHALSALVGVYFEAGIPIT